MGHGLCIKECGWSYVPIADVCLEVVGAEDGVTQRAIPSRTEENVEAFSRLDLTTGSLTMRFCEHAARIRIGFWFAWERKAPGIMTNAYGWQDGAPIENRPGETVHTWHLRTGATEEITGWTSLTKDNLDPAVQRLSIGILPEYVGRGWRQAMLRIASDWAFAFNGAEVVTCEVLGTNTDQLMKYHRDSLRGGPFLYGGEVWIPERYSLFTRMKPEHDE